MGIPQYLAMTEAEIAKAAVLPPKLARMGCHFSETGLAGLPEALPEGALLVLDDSTPMGRQSIPEIAGALRGVLSRFSCRGLVLDFQRPAIAPQRALAAFLRDRLPCPLAAPPEYAPENCAVFLPPVPIPQTVEDFLAPWQGREIWLDAGPGETTLRLTKQGCAVLPGPGGSTPGTFYDDALCCRYSIQAEPDGFSFRLRRDGQCVQALLSRAEGLSVTLAIGLWQELR